MLLAMSQYKKKPLNTFRALSSRNYRLFFGGQGLSLIGTWIQQIAMSWLVYRMTNSVVLLGIVGFASQIPTFIFGPFAGVLTDRANKRNILLWTQSLSLLQAIAIIVLVLTNKVSIPHILLLSLFLGIVNAFDAPTRQAFVIELVEKREDLGNAIALNSAIFTCARLVGPAIAGLIIAATGESVCFILNAISFVAVIIALLLMQLPPPKTQATQRHIFQELKEGISYTLGFAPIRNILFLLAMISLVGMSYTVLMPVFAKDILHGGPHTLGFLMAAIGTGALCGALRLASRQSVRGLLRIIPLASAGLGLSLILFSWSNTLWVSLCILFFTGYTMMTHMATSNTILQTIVEDKLRGRVMSFYTMAFLGMAPFGSLLAGNIAAKIGSAQAVFYGGCCSMIFAGIFALQIPTLRTLIRPIYVRKGIIQEVQQDLQQK
jgi:MFS family permease